MGVLKDNNYKSQIEKMLDSKDYFGASLIALEGLRKDKIIASNQEACVTISCNDKETRQLEDFGLEQFAALCIVSEVKLQKTTDQTIIAAQKSEHQKCQRCWNFWPSVGADSEHPDLCERCISVIKEI